MAKADLLIWPVHFQATEKQRIVLETFARDNRISMANAARTLLGEAMQARGIC
jgi:hypothetical protein